MHCSVISSKFRFSCLPGGGIRRAGSLQPNYWLHTSTPLFFSLACASRLSSSQLHWLLFSFPPPSACHCLLMHVLH
ncbi:hypothetical protein BS50DRAFT_253962 [Corynespora cassiicola Philippines]|uniref:Uncharacterized protein n=1 Tax=Corynespora cassiicola Philippines TaxID=1448308 RepID=A0A2T2P4B7_CORCC|nr:hypothetical protein BS50DRAFT_253962 [Corynespora cassiicola Philippines]